MGSWLWIWVFCADGSVITPFIIFHRGKVITDVLVEHSSSESQSPGLSD